MISIQLRICLLAQTPNGHQKLTGFVEFFTSIYRMISVHMLVISIVERCFRFGLNYFIPLKKLDYCTN